MDRDKPGVDSSWKHDASTWAWTRAAPEEVGVEIAENAVGSDVTNACR